MKKYKVTLTEIERSKLKAITSKSSHRSQKVPLAKSTECTNSAQL